jgi:hypothetical protein
MVIGVKLCYFGMRLENERFLEPTYCKKLKSKSALFGRTSESRIQDKRATSIIGGGK